MQGTATLRSVAEPGRELLLAQAAKAAALPPEQRDLDVSDFVLRSQLLDAALDLLLPSIDSPQSADPGTVAQGLALALKGLLLFPQSGGGHYQGGRACNAIHPPTCSPNSNATCLQLRQLPSCFPQLPLVNA